VTITCSAGESTLALNSEGQIIFFGPEVADNAIRAGHHQAFDEVVTHELVHTTQPKPVGSPLADRGHPQAVALKSRHYIFEDQLLEGATQAQTNYLRRLHDRDYEGAVTNIYPTFVAMVDEVQRVSGVAPETYYRQLSATPANLRTAYLSKCLLGREDERTQRDVFESLLKANVEAENAAAEAGGFTDTILASHRVLTRKILADLRGQ
jgi:hypothetical protein